MKNELFEKFKELLATEDIASIKHDVRELMSNFNSETAKEKQLQFEDWQKVEHEDEEKDFEFVPNEIDSKIEELYAEYKEKVKEHGKLIAAEQKKNLEEKRSVLKELLELIQDEENIAKAFNKFNELSEKWEEIGNIPGDQYQEIQDEFRKLRDSFFYNMSIYRQLREHDLLKNEKAKVELLEKIKELKTVDSIKDCDNKLKEYRKEWDAIGPTTRENYQAIGDEFFGVYREIIEKIQKHYDEQKEKQQENLDLKKEVVVELKELLSLELINHSTWIKKTQNVLDLQAKWKTIGFGPKKENEELWQEFRGLCDLFFEKKHEYYKEKNKVQEESKEKKQAIIDKAKAWEDSSDWKNASEALIKLQKEWKECGATFQKEEQKLWGAFRKVCDNFFERKKSYFANQDEINLVNLKAKQELIKEIEAFEISGNKSADLEKLKDFSKRFREIGFVPKKDLKEIQNSYSAALDSKYDLLKLKSNEKSIHRYKNRVESLLDSPNADYDIRKEKRLLYDKIDRLKNRVIQYENNINFFSGSGAEKMRTEVQRKIDSAQREIDEIRAKLEIFDQE